MNSINLCKTRWRNLNELGSASPQLNAAEYGSLTEEEEVLCYGGTPQGKVIAVVNKINKINQKIIQVHLKLKK